MSIVVVGSIAFDTIKTPSGAREKSLGGAANYFSVAAHFFAPIKMVGIIGDDFSLSHLERLSAMGVDISGIEKTSGPSFHWQGEYGQDLNEAKTIKTELNVFKQFSPKVPESYKDASTIFLANIDPELQIHVLRQMNAKVRALDTMNYWIESKNQKLKEAISMIDILFVNDKEVRLLTGEHNIVKAAFSARKLGASIVVVKRGEYGALLCTDSHISFVPAFPLTEVVDPTGAGDSFAAGFLGHLHNHEGLDLQSLKQAMIMGTVISSFVIEKFSFDRILEIDEKQIMDRKLKLIEMTKHW